MAQRPRGDFRLCSTNGLKARCVSGQTIYSRPLVLRARDLGCQTPQSDLRAPRVRRPKQRHWILEHPNGPRLTRTLAVAGLDKPRVESLAGAVRNCRNRTPYSTCPPI